MTATTTDNTSGAVLDFNDVDVDRYVVGGVQWH